MDRHQVWIGLRGSVIYLARRISVLRRLWCLRGGRNFGLGGCGRHHNFCGRSGPAGSVGSRHGRRLDSARRGDKHVSEGWDRNSHRRPRAAARHSSHLRGDGSRRDCGLHCGGPFRVELLAAVDGTTFVERVAQAFSDTAPLNMPQNHPLSGCTPCANSF